MAAATVPTRLPGGLFALGCRDCHALLGVPVDAEAESIRRAYLRIARQLHPDSNRQASPDQRQLATLWLSRWVNPAYAQLSQPQGREEQRQLICGRTQTLLSSGQTLSWRQGRSPALLTTQQPELAYPQQIRELASSLFTDLTAVPEQLGDLSELNLAWLMRQQMGKGSPPTAGPDQLERYLSRAEGYLRRKALPQAQLELRDALRLAPQESRAHALSGLVYLELEQPAMARISIRRALQLDPQQVLALEGKQRLEQQGHKIDHAPSEPSPEPRSGNWFTGLFSRRS